MSNRRQFFTATAASVALASVSVPALACPAQSAARHVGGSPTRAAFEALQGQAFAVRLNGGKQSLLQLQAVRDNHSGQAIEQFSLVLRGDTRQPLTAGVYALEHVQLGSVALRLDPSGRNAQGRLYRADFSLLA